MSDTKNSGESLLWVNVDCWSPAGQRGSKAWVLFQQAGEEEQIARGGFRCASGQQHTLLEINWAPCLSWAFKENDNTLSIKTVSFPDSYSPHKKRRQWWQSKWKGELAVRFNAEKMQ